MPKRKANRAIRNAYKRDYYAHPEHGKMYKRTRSPKATEAWRNRVVPWVTEGKKPV